MAKSGSEIELKQVGSFPARTFERSVQDFPPPDHVGSLRAVTSLTVQLSSFSDTVPAWGLNNARIMQRDHHLRDFWKSESTLSSAIGAISSRNAAFEWEIQADNERLETTLTDMLHMSKAQNIHGWIPFVSTFSQDFSTQDNGAFIEMIRDPSIVAGSRFRGAQAPVIGIGVLESGRCFRTGNPKIPIIYTDDNGIDHKMPWWSIIPTADLPSSMETMRGAGFCGVSRVLRAAHILREIGVYKDEKISGRFIRQIHFVGGVSKREIEDVTSRSEEEADNRNITRYGMPTILASLDPEKPVSVATIDLAQLPDNFDMDEEMRWYISVLALGLGADYQDLAPLPGGNIGSSAQSEILHRKSRGKGPALFMEYLQNAFRYYGVIPANAKFRFIEKDMAHEHELQELRTKQAEEFAISLRSGVITPEVARDLLVRRGFLEADDIAKIDIDYGLELLLGGNNNQMTGGAGGTTIGEDAQRTQKAMSPIIDEYTAREAGVSVWLKNKLAQVKQNEDIADTAVAIRELALAIHERDDTKELTLFAEALKEIRRIVGQKQPIVVNVPEQKQQPAPVVNVAPAETKVVIKEEKGVEEIEVLKRDEEGKMVKLRKTKK